IPINPRARSGCARMVSICFLSDAEGFFEAAVASSVNRAQQIRRPSGALLLNIYKVDCSTGPPTQPQVRLESPHAPGLHLEPRSANPRVRQTNTGHGHCECNA